MRAQLFKIKDQYYLRSISTNTGGQCCEQVLASTYGEGEYKLDLNNCKNIENLNPDKTDWIVSIKTKRVKIGYTIMNSIKSVKGSGDKIIKYDYIPITDNNNFIILKSIH